MMTPEEIRKLGRSVLHKAKLPSAKALIASSWHFTFILHKLDLVEYGDIKDFSMKMDQEIQPLQEYFNQVKKSRKPPRSLRKRKKIEKRAADGGEYIK